MEIWFAIMIGAYIGSKMFDIMLQKDGPHWLMVIICLITVSITGVCVFMILVSGSGLDLMQLINQ